MTTTGVARRGVLVAEVAVLVVTTVVDTVLIARTDGRSGLAEIVLVSLVPYVGIAVAVLAVLRRRFPRHVELIGYAVVGFSLLTTAGSAVWDQARAQPVAAETVAAVLLAGAVCRRLSPVRAVTLASTAGGAVVAAPIVRYGVDSPMALLAVPAALLWGVALAVGLVLRDADTRHAVELDRTRTNDRLQLARELHDLVAHHVSGIVVRVRAAQTLAGNPAVPAQNPAEVYGEIEEAAAEALVAMRKLVGMLRSTGHPLPAPGSALGEVLRTAAGDRADVSVEDGVDQLSLPPELANALHRVVLEALTNAHRHAPHATEVRLGAWLDGDELVLDIGNDGVAPGTQGSEGGYGIVGMTERITTLGGTLDAGPRRGGRWHVTARLPLGDEEPPFAHLSRGI